MKNKAQLESEYLKEAQYWETDATWQRQKSEKRAWRVATASLIVSLMSVGAVLGLTPLKTVEPFVVRVDNSTGLVDVMTGLTDSKETYEQSVNKYFIAKYLEARESYLPETRDHQRKIVGLFSDNSVSQEYAAYTDYRRNKFAPINVYGDSASVEMKIKNISFISDNVALVRYYKVVERAGKKTEPSHWISTIAFSYVQAPMTESDRLINPLGFQVNEYRNDPEVVGG